jgi:metallo-beta-lactamase class B
VNNALYPEIADHYARIFRILKSLPCDVFLGAHGKYYNMEAKFARLNQDGGANPFIASDGYKRYVAEREKNVRNWRNKRRMQDENADWGPRRRSGFVAIGFFRAESRRQ